VTGDVSSSSRFGLLSGRLATPFQFTHLRCARCHNASPYAVNGRRSGPKQIRNDPRPRLEERL
jgi:hypothetical protein